MKRNQLLYYLDDDGDDLIFFKNVAESLDQNVSLFSNGQELLQTLRFVAEKPDIIFLDLHMPILNGQEILHIIKNSLDYKKIPVVMISSTYPKKLVHYLQDSGADYLMRKSATNKDLKSALAEVLEIDWKNDQASA